MDSRLELVFHIILQYLTPFECRQLYNFYGIKSTTVTVNLSGCVEWDTYLLAYNHKTLNRVSVDTGTPCLSHLYGFRYLTHVNLCNLKISPSNLHVLTTLPLSHLSLRNAGLDNTSLYPLAKLQLVSLNISHNRRITDVSCFVHTCMEELNVSSTQLDDDGCKISPTVRKLNVSLTNITRIPHLHVTDLDISSTRVNDITTVPTSVTRLNLAKTNVTDIRCLANLMLTDLNLERVNVTDFPFVTSSISTLNLAYTNIKNLHWVKHAAYVNLTYTEADLSTLVAPVVELNLSRVHVTNFVIPPTLTSLNLSEAKVNTLEILAGSGLRELYMKNVNITDDSLIHLVGLPLLKLHIKYNRLSDSGVEYIQQIRTLRHLNLEGNSITSRGYEMLQQLPLYTLDVSFNLIRHIKGANPTLHHLNVTGNPIKGWIHHNFFKGTHI